MSMRPFMTGGVLCKNPNFEWAKDRGTEPADSGQGRFPLILERRDILPAIA